VCSCRLATAATQHTIAAPLDIAQLSQSSLASEHQRLPPLQLMEDLEQLKVLENGYKIKVITVDHCAHGVDEPHDVASIEAKLKELEVQAYT
jgi:hypothetical protein